MFQLHIPGTHLRRTSASEGFDSPQWLLLPQKGTIQPRVRHNHSLTWVGRDLVVLGGESVDGQPHQILVVCQYDDIYQHAQKDEDLDNLVLLSDLDLIPAHPLSTLSLSHKQQELLL